MSDVQTFSTYVGTSAQYAKRLHGGHICPTCQQIILFLRKTHEKNHSIVRSASFFTVISMKGVPGSLDPFFEKYFFTIPIYTYIPISLYIPIYPSISRCSGPGPQVPRSEGPARTP